MFDLSGSIALVTGSSRGIGRSLAEGLASAGATVVLNGLDPARLADTRSELASRFGRTRIHGLAFDVTCADEVEASIARIEDEIGPLSTLVNNAGVQHREPLLDVAIEDWDHVVRTNLTSAFLVGRAVARRMIPRATGKIINICSVQTDLARPSIAAYTAAKGGLRNLTRAMAAEWAAKGLQINGIAPGYIHTEMTENLVSDPAFNDWIIGRTPAARWGNVSDLVGPALFFASSASAYVNGQVLFVDGGMTAVV